MSRHLLVPVDGSPLSNRALAFAFEEFDDVAIVALHVLDPTDPGYSSPTDVSVKTEPPRGSDEWHERAAEEEERIFDDARELASDYGASSIPKPRSVRPLAKSSTTPRRTRSIISSWAATDERAQPDCCSAAWPKPSSADRRSRLRSSATEPVGRRRPPRDRFRLRSRAAGDRCRCLSGLGRQPGKNRFRTATTSPASPILTPAMIQFCFDIEPRYAPNVKSTATPTPMASSVASSMEMIP